ncbi:MAG: CBS domain-containing protein [Planctomycetaceae bacterium]
MPSLTVSDLMRSCPSAVVAEDLPLRKAAELLLMNDLSLLIAVSEDGIPVGAVADSAVIRHLLIDSNTEQNIGCILSRHIESVSASASINSVLHLFRSSCHSIVPVVDSQSRLTGLLFRQDIVRMLLSQSDAEALQAMKRETSEKPSGPHFLSRPNHAQSRPSDQYGSFDASH